MCYMLSWYNCVNGDTNLSNNSPTYTVLEQEVSLLRYQVRELQKDVIALEKRLGLKDSNGRLVNVSATINFSINNSEDFFNYLNFLYSLSTDIFVRYLEGTGWNCVSSDTDNENKDNNKTFKCVDVSTYNIYTLNYLTDKEKDKGAYMNSLMKLLDGIMKKENKCGVYTKGDSTNYGLPFYLKNLYSYTINNKDKNSIPTVFNSNMSDNGIDLDTCKDILNKIFN